MWLFFTGYVLRFRYDLKECEVNEGSRINPDGMYVGKVYSDMNSEKITKTFQGGGDFWRSIHDHPPAPLALLGQC